MPKGKYILGLNKMHKIVINNDKILYFYYHDYIITKIQILIYGPYVNKKDEKLLSLIDEALIPYIYRPVRKGVTIK